MTDDTTHFGYEEVPTATKSERVRGVFDTVANRYDLMNDLMSMGLHRWWKRFAVAAASVKPGQRVLDLAGGTGDVARLLSERVGPKGEVVVADINAAMLHRGRERLLDEGYCAGLHYIQADAERLPFESGAFDCVCIAFGLRNVTRIDRALGEMCRVLRPGGSVVVLEFSTPRLGLLRTPYDIYSFQVLPRLGQLVAKDAASYRYLAESIRRHPDQDALRQMLEEAGFEGCTVNNLVGGIVAVHRGFKF